MGVDGTYEWGGGANDQDEKLSVGRCMVLGVGVYIYVNNGRQWIVRFCRFAGLF